MSDYDGKSHSGVGMVILITTVFMSIFGAVAISVYHNPPPTEAQLKIMYERNISWCLEEMKGDAKFDKYNKYQGCTVKGGK